MKQLVLLSIVCLVVICACENPLNVKAVDLNRVIGNVLFNRSVLKTGNDYGVGYNNGNIRSDRIKLFWQKCNDSSFISYKIFRNNQLIKTFLKADSTIYVSGSLNQNTEYNYRIVACIKNGMAIEDTIKLKTPQFMPPNQLNYTFITQSSIKLTWHNRAESATSYVIQREDDNFGNLVTYTSSDTTLIDNTILNDHTYYYRIKAINAYEETDFSENQAFYFHYSMNAPTLYSLLQLHPGNNVRLNWSDNSTAETAFQIFRSTTSNANYTLIGSTLPNATQFTDTTVKQVGTTYYYIVKTYRDNESNNSNEMSILITEQQFVLYDFEGDNGGFISNNVNGWQCGQSQLGAHSGSHIWGAPLYGYYPDYADFELTSPTITLPYGAELEFYQKYYFNDWYDGGNVKISTNNGATWSILYPDGGYPYYYIYSSEDPGFSGVNSNWNLVHFDLSQYAGQQVKIKWTLTSWYSYYGWGIDDVKIGNLSKSVTF